MEMAMFPGQDLFDSVIDLVKEYLTSCQDRDSKVLQSLCMGLCVLMECLSVCLSGGRVQAA